MGPPRRFCVLLQSLLQFALLVCSCASAMAAGTGTDIAIVPLHRYSYQSWSSESGLPSNTVVDMVRDAEGYVWIATPNGLARFDGAAFEVFRSGDTEALESSRITRLFRDGSNRIWIATARNVAVFDGRSFAKVSGSEGLGQVTGITDDASGQVLVAGDRLMRVRERENGGARALALELEVDAGWTGRARALLRHDRSVWVAGDDGRLARFEAGIQEECSLPGSARDRAIQVLAWSSERLWVGTDRGLYTGGCHDLTAASLGAPREIRALSVDADDIVWTVVGEDLYRLAGDWMFEGPAEQAPPYFPDIRSIVADEDGGIWLGSDGAGLRYLWRSRVDRFGPEEGLVDAGVWTIAKDADGLAVGSNGGVEILRDGRFERLIPHTKLPSPSVYALLRDSRGRLWVGLRNGLVRFDASLERDLELDELSGLQVNGLLELEADSILVASSGGLFRWDQGALAILGVDSGLEDSRVRYLLRDRRGSIWVGTEDGLFVDREGDLKRFNSAGLDLTYITAILELSDGRLVVGSWNRGMVVRDADGGGFRALGPEQGLPSSNVFFLGEHEGWLVVSYVDGVYRTRVDELSRDRLQIDSLHRDPGDRPSRSRIRCCNGAGHGRGVFAEGALWVPSLYGVVSVALDGSPEPPPRVRLTGVVEGGGQSVSLPVSELHLDPGSRDLQIHYGAVDLRQAWPLQYRYRLEGFDRDWVDVEDRRLAIYTNLAPGTFRFEVQARRLYQPWGPSASFSIDVPKRFVETWPFRLFLGALVFPVLWILVRLRVAQLRRQKGELEALVEARTLELQDANRRLEAMNEALIEASVTDPLTGLHNRRFLREQVPGVLARLSRARLQNGGRDLVLGVFLIDIDHFKTVNDSYGHAVGDEVLKGLANSLRANLREGDVLVRWGGEEFLVLVTDVERGNLEATAERIRVSTAESRLLEGAEDPIRVTASLGYAAFPVSGIPASEQSFQTVLELADHALYAAKAAGRDRSATVELARFEPDEWPGRVRGADIDAWRAEKRARVVVSSGSGPK